MKTKLKQGDRVRIEKIITRDWESPMVMRNSIIIEEEDEFGTIRVGSDEKTIKETFNGCFWGRLSLSGYKITKE